MLRSYWKITSVALLVAIESLLTGCSTGREYSKHADQLKPKPGKGLVLIYFRGTGPIFPLSASEQFITKEFRPGTFLSYDADPGPLRLAIGKNPTAGDYVANSVLGGPLTVPLVALMQKKESANFNVVPNQILYVQAHSNGWRPILTERPSERAEKDIRGCRWINPTGN